MRRRFEEIIDANTVAAEVTMLRAASNDTIVIVEGSFDENTLSHFTGDACDIVIAYGRDNALGAIAIANEKQISGVVCLVDLDFSEILGGPIATENVIVTDDHDLETMIFRSTAFDKVLKEFGSRPKIGRIKSDGGDPREMIRNAATPLAILRFHSLSQGLGLKFEELKYTFVKRQNLQIDINEMIRVVLNNSRASDLDAKKIRASIDHLLSRRHNPWHMCHGHDLAEFLGKALQSALGNRRSIDVNLENVERALRLAYTFEDFSASNMFAGLHPVSQTPS